MGRLWTTLKKTPSTGKLGLVRYMRWLQDMAGQDHRSLSRRHHVHPQPATGAGSPTAKHQAPDRQLAP